jgi:methyl-accepting chemotaxis protein
LTELPPELFLKKLIGISDVEAALKRLDKLTHEEARMATAQILKATRTVDDRVGAVNEQVAGVHDRVASVGERVKVIGERVKVVNDKVAEVIDGAQPPLHRR